MNIKWNCHECGEIEVEDDMGLWCSGCGTRVEETEILSSLMHSEQSLIKKIDALTKRIEVLEQKMLRANVS